MTWLKHCAASVAVAAMLATGDAGASEADGGANRESVMRPRAAVLRAHDPGLAAGGYSWRRGTRPPAWSYEGQGRPWYGSRFDDTRRWQRGRWGSPHWDRGRRTARAYPYADVDRNWDRYGHAPRRYDGYASWRRGPREWRPDLRSDWRGF